MMKTYTIQPHQDGMRLCDFLTEQGYSHTMLIRLKQEGGLTVNGAFHRNIDPIYAGDTVTVDFPDKDAVLTPNGNLHIAIIYEDEDTVIFDKPDDILVHPATREFDDALGNFFAYRYPGVPFRPLGRLDRHTTGLCLMAKNKLAAVKLNRAIAKTYIAVAQGHFDTAQGTVNAPLLRVPGSTIRRKVDPAGQESITHYRVLAEYPGHTLLELKLETGRTHQIRVHMAYLGHPLAGDTLYGGSTEFIQRQALHCHTMDWEWNGKKLHAESPLPPDMQKLCSE